MAGRSDRQEEHQPRDHVGNTYHPGGDPACQHRGIARIVPQHGAEHHTDGEAKRDEEQEVDQLSPTDRDIERVEHDEQVE